MPVETGAILGSKLRIACTANSVSSNLHTKSISTHAIRSASHQIPTTPSGGPRPGSWMYRACCHPRERIQRLMAFCPPSISKLLFPLVRVTATRVGSGGQQKCQKGFYLWWWCLLAPGCFCRMWYHSLPLLLSPKVNPHIRSPLIAMSQTPMFSLLRMTGAFGGGGDWRSAVLIAYWSAPPATAA